MEATISRMLEEIKQELASLYGDRLVKAILYGSHARGEATEHSDVDVMLVLKGEKIDAFAEAERTADLGMRILEHHGKLVAFLPVSEEELHQEYNPLMMNVRREGVTL